MRLLHLSPGTGSFYCGSCLRDDALAKALRREGCDVVVGQMYLPAMLESEPAGEGPFFFGGVNAYLQQTSAIFRRTPRWLDAALDRPALLRWVSRYASMTASQDVADLTVSMLQGPNGRQAKELARLVDWLSAERAAGRRFDAVCLSNALLLGLVEPIGRASGAPVVVSLQGEDTFVDSLPQPQRDQAWALMSAAAERAAGLVAVSDYYRLVMADRLGLDPQRLHVVPNGIELQGYDLAAPLSRPGPPVIGYLARMCPAKGLHTLVEAFIRLANDPSEGRCAKARLCVVGAQLREDRPFVAGLRAQLARAGLAERCTWHPGVSRSEKLRLLKGMSLLSVPATYGESFGLYTLEAMAAGVPLVQPEHAAVPEILATFGGGVLCKPDDPVDLAAKLADLLGDEPRRLALAEAGRSAVHAGGTEKHMAQRFEQVLRGIVR
jgi:glycosyltransferase involved in cell wall biosynthesis